MHLSSDLLSSPNPLSRSSEAELLAGWLAGWTTAVGGNQSLVSSDPGVLPLCWTGDWTGLGLGWSTSNGATTLKGGRHVNIRRTAEEGRYVCAALYVCMCSIEG